MASLDTLRVIADFAIVGTFFVHLSMLRAMREAMRNQNAITVHQIIVDPDFRHDRGVLINLQGRALKE